MNLFLANITLITVAIYAIFTIATTVWRTPFLHQMNQADNQAANLATESLLNYETVKLFNNEKYESEKYDDHLLKYANAKLKVEYSLASLNFGQQAIITLGMGVSFYLTMQEITKERMTTGDLVLVSGLLQQLARPLGFLGSTYRNMISVVISGRRGSH